MAGLAPRHLAALTQIVLHGPMSVSALTEILGVALTTTSLLVTQLAETGLVERQEDVADHRRTLASVRQSRADEVLELVGAHLQPLHRTLDRLGRRRGEALLVGLGVLVEELNRQSTPPDSGREAS
ncbi:MAG: MarR family winged helix-turn-helix transcriptional regulator [Candidatus Dormibacteria bacterium]